MGINHNGLNSVAALAHHPEVLRSVVTSE